MLDGYSDEERRARDRARLALERLEVIRVTISAVPLGYRLLYREGVVSAKRVPGHPDKADVRLRGEKK